MNPSSLPVARELFAQWSRARGGLAEPATRAFSRGWEELLTDAAILSAADRSAADRDIRALAAAGWVGLKTVRYKAYLIDRVTLPVERETAWKEAFGFVPASDAEARQIAEHPWTPDLAFVRRARLGVPFAELRQLDDYLRRSAGAGFVPASESCVPLKERSLEIFGDEKRLDVLADSALFREGRLTLARLGCATVPEPLGWRRGPAAAAAGPMLVLENAATWDSFARWNAGTARFAALIYGGGNRFVEGVAFLAEIFSELGGPRPVEYFGDLDAAGLRIPQRAAGRARAAGLPEVRPFLPAYRRLLEFRDRAAPGDDAAPRREECDWLGPLADDAWAVLSTGRRLAQEHVGWEVLRGWTYPDEPPCPSS